MNMYLLSFSLFLLFVFAHSQEDGDPGAFRQSPDEVTPEQEATEPPPPPPPQPTTVKSTKKPIRRTTTSTAQPQPLAKTDATEPIREECTGRVDIIVPFLSQCRNCTVNTDCRSDHVCCPVQIVSLFGSRNPDSKCCVIKKPIKPTTEAP